MNKKAIGWFSAGVTSAVAIKMALSMYEEVEIYYFDTGQVHSDNKRFIKECTEWYGQEIIILKSEKFDSPIDVARKIKYINGPSGARCTMELKKELRYKVQKEKGDDLKNWDQIFGFEFSKKEINRAVRFKEQYPEANPVFPLISKNLTKPNCLGLLEQAGIKRPVMYDLGYNNNNCIGCFKGGMGYWNKIRKDFPDIFEETAKMEREVGATCLKTTRNGKSVRVYLDELDPEAGRHTKEIMPQCGVVCQTEFNDIISKKTDLIFEGKLDINEEEDEDGCNDGI